MKVYLLPSIGADERLFSLLNFAGYEPVHIKWLPHKKDEDLYTYAGRLVPQIDTSAPFAIIGMSFGGIITMELAKHVKPAKIIVLSTIKTKHELPPFFRLLKFIPVYKIITPWMVQNLGWVMRIFMLYMNKAEFRMFMQMVYSSNIHFIKWAWSNILRWQNTDVPPGTYHIHGTKDEFIPIKYIKNCEAVEGGSHYMLIKTPQLISNKILEHLQQ